MIPGDIIFFSDKDIEDKPNILGQWALTMQREQWTHVAISLSGPLIVHAMPDGGVQFGVLEEDVRNDVRYTVNGRQGCRLSPWVLLLPHLLRARRCS